MFGSDILDVAIGVTFVFLIFSLIVTATHEVIEARLKARATTLEIGIRQILGDESGQGLAKAFYDHPLVDALSKGVYQGKGTQPHHLPSYIPTQTFSAVVMALRASGEIAENSRIGGLLADLDRLTGGVAEKTRKEVEHWFDGAMDRISGVYKRRTQAMVLVLAVGVTLGLNINTVTIIRSLTQDKALRTAIAAQAQAYAATPQSTSGTDAAVRARFAEIEQLGLPIGWDAARRADVAKAFGPHVGEGPAAWMDAFELILGWLATVVAISLGSPFWFDALNKIMVLRATVKPDEKSQPDGSKG